MHVCVQPEQIIFPLRRYVRGKDRCTSYTCLLDSFVENFIWVGVSDSIYIYDAFVSIQLISFGGRQHVDLYSSHELD